MSDSRLEALETRVAFQDELLQKLDEALADQQKQLLDIRQALRLITEQVNSLEESAENVEDGKPPHY